MSVPRSVLKKWEKVREFALRLPGAAEPRGGAAYRYSPWGETVAKVNEKVFVFRVIAPKRLIAELESR